MTTAVSSSTVRPAEIGAGDVILSAAGTAARKAAASAATTVIGAVASSAASELAKVITGKTKKASTKATPKTTKKTTTAAKKTTTAKKPGEFDFLKDKSLSIEERLFKLLAMMSDKYEDALEKKLADIQKTTAEKKSDGGGLLQGALGAIGKATGLDAGAKAISGLLGSDLVKPLLKQLGGPVLAAAATAAGLPMLAPIALRLGSAAADKAPELWSALAGEVGSTAATSSKSSKDNAPDISAGDQAELQILMNKQKEMFSTLSNVLRAMHDTKMSIVGNIR